MIDVPATGPTRHAPRELPRRTFLGLAGAVLLAGCAASGSQSTPAATSSAGGGTGSATSDVDRVTVGLVPILDVAPVHLGVEKGFFRQRGIEVKTENAAGGAALLPAVVSGQYQFAFSNVTSLVIAQSRGLPIQAIAAGSASTGKPGADFGGVVVPKDSPIKSVGDLPGRSIAINTLNNINDTLLREAVSKAGGDPAAVKFVEIPHSDMPAALAARRVDAAWEVEPFLTVVKNQGARDIYSMYAEAAPNLAVAVYFTTSRLAQTDPDLVQRFTEALRESHTYASANPAEARRILTSYTKIDPSVIPSLTLPAWPKDINRASVELQAELAQRYGLIQKPADLDALLP